MVMSIMIKLIACDMDGTLLNEEGNLSEDFYCVYEKLMKKNIKLVIASGRQYYQLLKTFESIWEKLIFVAENGTIVKYNDKELFLDPLPKEAVTEVVRFSENVRDVYLIICGKKSAYINSGNNVVVNEVKKYYVKYKVVDNFYEIDDDILKIAVLDVNGAEENSYTAFNKEFKDKLTVAVSGKIWLDIYNIGTSKGSAIKLLQNMFNIEKEETMSFGDYYNDIEMLNMSYHSYAMDNAPLGVKQHARFIARSNNDDGVIRVIKEKVLNE